MLRGSLQHWKKLLVRFPNEGLEGGAGWQPAAQHWKKPRFPNEGLEEGCCVAAAALEEAKIPE